MDINRFLVEVMTEEAEAVGTLIAQTNGQYDKVVECMSACLGRIVFMGVGKSGHIGKKLAATFSSTGTTSFFVHCTEAMHGDLGMLTDKDIAVLISNSGNTREVVSNLRFIKAIGCKMVAFTSRADSILANECDYQLIYPNCKEADPLHLAPTSSSTMTLVLGDAIACALSRIRGFSRTDFYKFHPEGALGTMLAKESK